MAGNHSRNRNKKKAASEVTAILIAAFALLLILSTGLAIWLMGQKTEPPEEEPEIELTPEPSPSPEPKKVYAAGYFLCEDGLFYPEELLTAGELVKAASRAAGEELAAPEEPDEVLTESRFEERLRQLFPELDARTAVRRITGRGDETVTRAEAAAALNLLFDIAPGADRTVFPDVEPGYWAAGDIAAAAESPVVWEGEQGLPLPGFVWVNGYLYCAGDDGYFLKNTWLGTLYFTPGGRYTSGSLELDGYVAAAIREHTDETMTREERLFAMYEYVRDSFTYLRRHYYRIGDLTWPTEEALTMYSTGKGNCYCYSSAFWAAARGLGYDAKAVSGTYGEERAPHGWVEIIVDGRRLTYDVEIEMTIRRNGRTNRSLFAMDDGARMAHGYVELTASDNLAPRETNEGLLPR